MSVEKTRIEFDRFVKVEALAPVWINGNEVFTLGGREENTCYYHDGEKEVGPFMFPHEAVEHFYQSRVRKVLADVEALTAKVER